MSPARTGFGVAALTFLIDQVSKALFLHYRDPFSPDGIAALPFFRLIYVQNKGISLGMLTAGSDGQRWALVAITLAISMGAAVWLGRETNKVDVLGLGLIVGGAAGNVLDRARLGYVTDFLNLHFGPVTLGSYHSDDFQPFLVFNVADAAITVGVLVLLARAVLAGGPRANLEKTDA